MPKGVDLSILSPIDAEKLLAVRKKRNEYTRKRANRPEVRAKKRERDLVYAKSIPHDAMNDAFASRKLRFYKTDTKRRGHVFMLARNEFIDTIRRECFYCEAPVAGGIDRVDNDKTYMTGNIVPACSRCNLARHLQTQTEFISWLEIIRDKIPRIKERIRQLSAKDDLLGTTSASQPLVSDKEQ